MAQDKTKSLDEQLYMAIMECSPDKVKELLQQGADANVLYPPAYPRRPLSHCCSIGNHHVFENPMRIAKLLMEAGADPHLSDSSGKPPICNAASPGILKVMLTCGPNKGDPNRMDDNGFLPLQYAFMQDHMEMLLKHGADPFKQNAKGKTSLETFAKTPALLKLIMTEAVLKPLYDADGKIDLRTLLDESGQPTEAMRLMMTHAIPDALGNPDTYRNGIFDMGEMIPHLPQEMWQKVDFSPYRRRETETPGEGEHIKRYRRPKPDDIAR